MQVGVPKAVEASLEHHQGSNPLQDEKGEAGIDSASAWEWVDAVQLMHSEAFGDLLAG